MNPHSLCNQQPLKLSRLPVPPSSRNLKPLLFSSTSKILIAPRGLEPQYSDPESDVLPLDDRAEILPGLLLEPGVSLAGIIPGGADILAEAIKGVTAGQRNSGNQQ